MQHGMVTIAIERLIGMRCLSQEHMKRQPRIGRRVSMEQALGVSKQSRGGK